MFSLARHSSSNSRGSSGGAIGRGQLPAINPLALLGHHELFHRYEQRRRVKKVIASRPVDSFLDLKDGDYVVHVAHGIAKFMGMHTIAKEGKSEEYLTLRFAENAALHVPAARINLIQKYIGGFQGHPQLVAAGQRRVGEAEGQGRPKRSWTWPPSCWKSRRRARRELGTAYPPDTEWQKEFEAEFPYEPTHDQITGAEEIKQDMQQAAADGSAAVRRRGLRQNRTGHAGRVQGDGIWQAGGGAGADHRAGRAARSLVHASGWPIIRSMIESISRFKTAKQQKEIVKQAGRGRGGYSHRHASPAQQGRQICRPGPGGDRRRAALRRDAQRAAQADAQNGGCADHVGHADPAHAAHVHAGPARYQFADHRAAGSPQHRHRSDARSIKQRIKPAILRELQPRRAGLFRPQPRPQHHRDGRRSSASWSPTPASSSATARWARANWKR